MRAAGARRSQPQRLSRRQALRAIAAGAAGALALPGRAAPQAAVRPAFGLAAFTADVTPPAGHPLLAGLSPPAAAVADPLFVRGLALLGSGKPVVFAAVDWCEIRNDAYERWRAALAAAAGTEPGRVLVSSVHQHDAPLADLGAQRLLEERRLAARICDLEFHETAVRRAAAALAEAMKAPSRLTHVGLGKARVEGVASNRRYLDRNGKPAFDRGSTTGDAYARAQPEGTIDPWLRTLSFWEGERPLAALSAYATHPMSTYRTGKVSADFVGLARAGRQTEEPGAVQVYASGASGNVTAGKYNDGGPDNRRALAGRLQAAMAAAWKATAREALDRLEVRAAPLRLEPRAGAGFTVEDLEKKLSPGAGERAQILAALAVSWRRRVEAGTPIDVAAVDLGAVQLLLLPAESYVEYQLHAQELRPDSFVVAAGYGECAPGYIPTEQAFAEGDTNLADWCWVSPGAESRLKAAIAAALKKA
jgi:hypothetical protein